MMIAHCRRTTTPAVRGLSAWAAWAARINPAARAQAPARRWSFVYDDSGVNDSSAAVAEPSHLVESSIASSSGASERAPAPVIATPTVAPESEHYDVSTYPHRRIMTPGGAVLYPRQPPTTYSLFFRDAMRNFGPDQRAGVSHKISALWHSLDNTGRKKYDAECSLQRTRHRLALAAFRTRHPDVDVRVLLDAHGKAVFQTGYHAFVRDYFVEREKSGRRTEASLEEAAKLWRNLDADARANYAPKYAPNGIKLIQCDENGVVNSASLANFSAKKTRNNLRGDASPTSGDPETVSCLTAPKNEDQNTPISNKRNARINDDPFAFE